MQITVAFADGSVGTIAYLSGGDRRFSRERVEVYGNGGVGVLQDFRDLTCMRNGRRQRKRAWLNPDKGHRAEVETFLAALLSGEASPVPFEQHLLTMQATFEALDSARQGQPRVVTVFDAAQEHRP
jgi:predicted dehydrogenase